MRNNEQALALPAGPVIPNACEESAHGKVSMIARDKIPPRVARLE